MTMDQSTVPPRKRRRWPWVLLLAVIAFVLFSIWPESYVVRSQVSEGASLAEGAKSAIADYYASKHKFPLDNRQAGLAEPGSITGDYVSSLSITNGTITATYGNKAAAGIAGKKLVFSPRPASNTLRWTCDSSAGSTVEIRDRPTICRP